jgi:VanZ family protein
MPLMSAALIVLKSNTTNRLVSVRKEWVPVVCTIIFICFTSTTFMGGANSQKVVNAAWKLLFGTWHASLLGHINYELRKAGHFLGYGAVGVIFRNAWYATARAFSLVVKRWLDPFAGFLAILSTFIVGSLDEFHQAFTPGRVGCLHDALLDTSGAIALNLIFWAFWLRRRGADRFRLSTRSSGTGMVRFFSN